MAKTHKVKCEWLYEKYLALQDAYTRLNEAKATLFQDNEFLRKNILVWADKYKALENQLKDKTTYADNLTSGHAHLSNRLAEVQRAYDHDRHILTEKNIELEKENERLKEENKNWNSSLYGNNLRPKITVHIEGPDGNQFSQKLAY